MNLDHIEHKFELKFAEGDAKTGVFSGYGAVFGNMDSHGDVIEKGAFKDTLRAWEDKGKYPPMLLQHGGMFGPVDDMLPVGKWTKMEENSRGLKVEGELFALSTERGQYLHEGMKAGVLDGLSIGYRAVKYELGTKPDQPRRKLQGVDLVELSIVTFPSNDRARISGVKSDEIDGVNSLSDAEALLREAGGAWSKKAARDFISRVSKIARREAADDRSVNDLLAQIKAVGRTLSQN
jgi:hypothetical protein